jgi:hypothetical protein
MMATMDNNPEEDEEDENFGRSGSLYHGSL